MKQDLDLVTKFQKRNVDWNVQDIEFDIPEGMGTIDENGVLHTGDQNVSGDDYRSLKGFKSYGKNKSVRWKTS